MLKRYDIRARGYRDDSWDSVEAPDGDWVRYEDVAEALRLYENLAAAFDLAQAAAKASHAELEDLRARVTRAVGVLSTPGNWSEFARAALKELRGG